MKSKKTIVLSGGLGNQLFELCAGLYFEKEFKETIFYDVSNLKIKQTQESGNYSRKLEIFDLIPAERILQTSIRIHNFLTSVRKLFKNEKYFFENIKIGDSFGQVSNKTRFVHGHFQSSQLAEDMWPDLEYLMKNSKTFLPIFSKPKVNQIAIHIRFGDYKNDSATKIKHGLTDINYFVQAVEYFHAKNRLLDNLLVITDNKLDAQEFVGDAFSHFNLKVQSSTDLIKDFTDLALSTNIVISNSTFSWWAGFIGYKLGHSDVISPRPWMADSADPELPIYVNGWHSIHRKFSI